eukprot:TRINITY_DN1030_c0_g1_i3.p1 TRINITY_DN1030_c0_g1~~TRINITY_DN1030_c0_g1_i3.p1  ORF type:complete len:692 (+),score=68.05 TRINITY_DN1030_c0_g1_i3:194-2269(+)
MKLIALYAISILFYTDITMHAQPRRNVTLPSEEVRGIRTRVKNILDFGVDIGRKQFPPDAYEFARFFESRVAFEARPQPLTPADKGRLRDIIAECEVNPQPARGQFVRVQDGEFRLQGKDFTFVGFNSYQIVRLQLSLPYAVDNLLQRAQDIGLKVARIWLFSDNIHPGPFQWDENVMRAIDAIIQKATFYDIKIVFAFANYWEHFLGAEQYVYWSQGTLEGKNIRDFYEDEGSQLLYMAHVCKMVNRVNSITGVRWRDEPTIMAWNLMNEPRCPACDTTKWIRDMAAFVKSIDPNHLVTTGMEGFSQNPSQEGYFDNPSQWSICEGTDFIAAHRSAAIDYATIHIYPEHRQWDFKGNKFCNVGCQDIGSQAFYEARLEESSRVLKKPMVVEETGMSIRQKYRESTGNGGYVERAYTRAQRVQFYKTLLGSMLSGIERGDSVGGFMFWMAITDNYPDYDGFSIALDESVSFEAVAPVNFRLLEQFRNKAEVQKCVQRNSGWRPNPIRPLPITVPVQGNSVAQVLVDATRKLRQLQGGDSISPPPTTGDCTNIPPSDQFTCQEQKEFGKCNAIWMLEGDYCKKTCNRCGESPAPSDCTNIPPSNEFTCQQQKGFGQCDARWMIEGDYCKRTCGRCFQTPAPTPRPPSSPAPGRCTNIAPDDRFTCQQQRDFGKCNESWMLAGDFCKRTCGRC